MNMRRHSDIHEDLGKDPHGQLSKGMTLLAAIAKEERPLSLGDLARGCGLPKATAHRLLATLCELQLARSLDDGHYSLGSSCLTLGSAYLAGLDLRREAQPVMRDLVRETGETAHLGVSDGHRVVLIEKIEPDRPVRMVSRVGSTSPLHATAVGKILLAYSSPELVQHVAAHGLERLTPNTITDHDELRFALARARDLGFAMNDTEHEEGIRCVVAPVFDHRGEVVAGLSVSCPEYRTSRDRLRELANVVMNAAEQISKRLGYTEQHNLSSSRSSNLEPIAEEKVE